MKWTSTQKTPNEHFLSLKTHKSTKWTFSESVNSQKAQNERKSINALKIRKFLQKRSMKIFKQPSIH